MLLRLCVYLIMYLFFFIFIPFLGCSCTLPSKLETCIELVTVLANDQIFVVLLTLRWKASCLETGLLLLMSLQYTNRLTYTVTATCLRIQLHNFEGILNRLRLL